MINFPVSPTDNQLFVAPTGVTYRWSSVTTAWLMPQGTDADSLILGFVSPLMFGAAGNGVVDDTAAVQAALNSGHPVNGLGLTYAVSGNIILPANIVLTDAKFIQLAPNTTNVRTLFADHVDNVHLARVTVNRNGDGSITAQSENSNAAGLFITGGSGHVLEDIEVYGNNSGCGIFIHGATDWILDRPYVHDIKVGTASTPADAIVDDVVNSIAVGGINGARWKLRDYRINNIQTERIDQPPAWINTRGVAVAGPSVTTLGGFSISGGTINGVGQGMDISGGDNVQGFTVSDCVHENCTGPAFKCSNTVTSGTFTNCIAFRPGMVGFLVSASDDVVIPIDTAKIEFIGCQALQVGFSRPTSDLTYLGAGFYVEEGNPLNMTWPRSVRFIGCTADHGGLDLMQRGFHSEITSLLSGDGETWIECIDCSVHGGAATTSRFGNLNQGYEYRNFGGTQSIPNNAFTTVLWDNVSVRRAPFNGATNGEIRMSRTGIVNISAAVTFAANATGSRGIKLQLNGGDLGGTQTLTFAASAGNVSSVRTSFTYPCNVGDIFTVQVFQDSGGALNINSVSGVTTTMVDYGRGRT